MKTWFITVILLCAALSANALADGKQAGVGNAAGAPAGSASDKAEEASASFNKLFDEWRNVDRKQSFSSAYPGWDKIFKIAKLGPSAVPGIIHRMEKNDLDNLDRMALCSLLAMITGKDFLDDEWPVGKHSDDVRIKLYIKWWKEDRKETPKKFTDLIDKLDLYEKQGKSKNAEDTLVRIRYMGIEVLPLLIEKIKAGDTRLIPLVKRHIQDESVGEKPTAESIHKWWEQNKVKLTLPPVQSGSSSEKSGK